MNISSVLMTLPVSSLSLGVMFLILAASVFVFVTLVRRETLHRRALELTRWATSRGLRVIDLEHTSADVELVRALSTSHPRVRRLIQGDTISLMQMRSDDPPQVKMPAPVWHLLVMKIESDWPATGLRPAARSVSIIDLLPLSSYASLAPNVKFMVFGSDSAAARKMPSEHIAKELPNDIGLLLIGKELVLDFSGRTFDEIEMKGIIEIAERITQMIAT